MPELGLRKRCSEEMIERESMAILPGPVDPVRRGFVRSQAGRYRQTSTTLEVSRYPASELEYQGGAIGQGPGLSGGVPGKAVPFRPVQ